MDHCLCSRVKETSHINKSLFMLGHCIALLANGAGKPSAHVPYRSSVLTQLLRDSLGGNARTTLLATISPSEMDYKHTLSTLRYADRARHIVTSATVNQCSPQKTVATLKVRVMLQAHPHSILTAVCAERD